MIHEKVTLGNLVSLKFPPTLKTWGSGKSLVNVDLPAYQIGIFSQTKKLCNLTVAQHGWDQG